MSKIERIISVFMGMLFLISLTGIAQEKVEITFSWQVTAERIPLIEEAIEDFEGTHPNIKVNFMPVAGRTFAGVGQKILALAAAGNLPDVCKVTLEPFIRRGLLRNLSEEFIEPQNYDLSDFSNVGVLRRGPDKDIYAINFYINQSILLYNKDAFSEVGLAYPADWTWDSFLEAAQQLTRTDAKGKIDRFGVALPMWWAEMRLFALGNGADIVNESVTDCTITSLGVVEAYRFMYDLMHKYHVTPTLEERGREVRTGQEGPLWRFDTGTAAMHIGGSWMIVEGAKKVGEKFEWDIASVPYKKEKVTMFYGGSTSFVIPTQSKHPQEAWEFLKYLVGTENQIRMGLAAVGPPTRISAMERVVEMYRKEGIPPVNISLELEQLKKGGVFCDIAHSESSKIYDSIDSVNDLIFRGEISIEEGLKTIEQQVDWILAGGK